MSIDEPAAGSGSRGDLDDQAGNPGRIPAAYRHLRVPGQPTFKRTYLSLLPWRNFRRVLFLIVALMSVVALKRSAGGFFHRILESVTLPPAAEPAHPVAPPTTTVHLQPGPPPK
jgi:hypothetical protein